jgi:hypothetical protein
MTPLDLSAINTVYRRPGIPVTAATAFVCSSSAIGSFDRNQKGEPKLYHSGYAPPKDETAPRKFGENTA